MDLKTSDDTAHISVAVPHMKTSQHTVDRHLCSAERLPRDSSVLLSPVLFTEHENAVVSPELLRV